MDKTIRKNLKIYLAAGFIFLSSFLLDNTISSLNLHTKFLDLLFGSVSNFITLLIIMLGMTSLFLYDKGKKKWIKPLWLSVGITIIVVLILKNIILRLRPEDIEVMHMLALYSFPSLHSAVVFSTLPVLNKGFPKLRYAFIIFAVFVALNRLYFNAHFLSDVIGGAIIGYLIGEIICSLK